MNCVAYKLLLLHDNKYIQENIMIEFFNMFIC